MLDKNPKFYHKFFQHYRGEVVNGVRYKRIPRATLISHVSCGKTGFNNIELCRRLQERFGSQSKSFYNYFFKSEQGIKDFEKLFEDRTPYNSKKIKDVFYNNYVVKENKTFDNINLQFQFIVDFLNISNGRYSDDIEKLNGGPSQVKRQSTSETRFTPKTTETNYTPSIKSTEFKPVQSTY